jgi:hypothetical protein
LIGAAATQVAEGLAHNCLGVDAMLVAVPPEEGVPFEARRDLSPWSREGLQRAADHHRAHLAVLWLVPCITGLICWNNKGVSDSETQYQEELTHQSAC